MKQLRKMIVNGLTALSLVLFVVTAVLWLRSYWGTQFVGRSTPSGWCGILSMGGLLRFEDANYADTHLGWSYVAYPTPAGGLWDEVAARDRYGGPLRRAGFAYARIDYTSDGKRVRRAVYLPHASLCILFAIAPAFWLKHVLRKRPRLGFCPTCGYDLRASSERCPECGNPVPRGHVMKVNQ